MSSDYSSNLKTNKNQLSENSDGRIIPSDPKQNSGHNDGNDYLQEQLTNVQKEIKRVDFLSALTTLSALLIFYVLLFVLFDHWVFWDGLSVSLRTTCFIIGFISFVLFLGKKLYPLFRYRINPIFAAKVLEESRPTSKNSILNWFLLRREHLIQTEMQKNGQISSQMLNQTDAQERFLKNEILQGVVSTAVRDVQSVPDDLTVDHSPIIRSGILLTVIFAIFVFYTIFSPKDPFISLKRLLLPTSTISAPQIVRFDRILPGNAICFQGDHLKIETEISGAGSAPVFLVYSTADGRLTDQKIPMKKNNSRLYTVEFPPEEIGFREGIRYQILVGNLQRPLGRSDEFEITVRPAITFVVEKMIFEYPKYTGLAPQTFEHLGEIRALEGTKITLKTVSNIEMRKALFLPTDAQRHHQLMTVDPNDPKRASVSFVLTKENRGNQEKKVPAFTSYQLKCFDENDNINRSPDLYSVSILDDLSPSIDWINPSKEKVKVAIDGQMKVQILAFDTDFALRRVRLHFRRNEQQMQEKIGNREKMFGVQKVDSLELLEEKNFLSEFPVKFTEKNGQNVFDDHEPTPFTGEIRLQAIISPKKLNLEIGDEIEYWAEAIDTRLPEPNSAITSKLAFVVVPSGEGTSQHPSAPSDSPNKAESTDQQKQKNANDNNSKDENSENNPNSQSNSNEQSESKNSDDNSDSQKSTNQNSKTKESETTAFQNNKNSNDDQSVENSAKENNAENKNQQNEDQQNGKPDQNQPKKTDSEQSKSEQSGAEQSGSEQSGSEQSGAAQSGAEQSGAEQSGSEQSGSEQSGAEQSGSEQSGSEQSGSEQSGADQSGAEQSGSEQSGAEQSGADQSGAEQSGSEQSGAEQSGSGQSGNQDSSSPIDPKANPGEAFQKVIDRMKQEGKLPSENTSGQNSGNADSNNQNPTSQSQNSQNDNSQEQNSQNGSSQGQKSKNTKQDGSPTTGGSNAFQTSSEKQQNENAQSSEEQSAADNSDLEKQKDDNNSTKNDYSTPEDKNSSSQGNSNEQDENLEPSENQNNNRNNEQKTATQDNKSQDNKSQDNKSQDNKSQVKTSNQESSGNGTNNNDQKSERIKSDDPSGINEKTKIEDGKVDPNTNNFLAENAPAGKEFPNERKADPNAHITMNPNDPNKNQTPEIAPKGVEGRDPNVGQSSNPNVPPDSLQPMNEQELREYNNKRRNGTNLTPETGTLGNENNLPDNLPELLNQTGNKLGNPSNSSSGVKVDSPNAANKGTSDQSSNNSIENNSSHSGDNTTQSDSENKGSNSSNSVDQNSRSQDNQSLNVQSQANQSSNNDFSEKASKNSKSSGNGNSGNEKSGTDSLSKRAGTGGGTGTGQGDSNDERFSQEDAADLRYADQATTLALDYLDEQLQGTPDQKLLDDLGWNKEQLRDFVSHWKEMKAQTQTSDKEEQKFQERLLDLGLRPGRSDLNQPLTTTKTIEKTDASRETGRYRPPRLIEQRYRFYRQGISTQSPKE